MLSRFQPILRPSSSAIRHASSASGFDIFSPTEEHEMLRKVVREWTESEVDPQALEHNREEKLNLPLLRKTGELGCVLAVREWRGFPGALRVPPH